MQRQVGFGIIEVIVAMGIFLIIAVTAITTVVGSFSTNRLSDEETQAYLLAQEGLEAARSLRNRGWDTPFLTVNCASGCGLTVNANLWEWSGSSDTLGDFTRTVTVASAHRTGAGNIVANGGTNDPDTKRVTSTVSWTFSPNRNNTVSLVTYLTNWLKTIPSGLDITGNDNGNKVVVQGNYAYIILDGGTPNFYVVDISNPISPTVAGSVNVSSTPIDLAVSGNYAYLTTGDKDAEFQVFNVANPASPTLAGSLALTGNDKPQGVFVVGNTAYLTRDSGKESEFYVINITTPTAPSLTGSVELGATAYMSVVLGNYAYVGTDSNTTELVVINLTAPTNPTVAGSLDLTGNSDAIAIDGAGSTVVIGRTDGLLEIVSVSTPTSPSLVSTFNANASVNDLDYVTGLSVVFLATDYTSAEYQMVDISTPTTPSLLSYFDFGGNLNGVIYDAGQNLAVVAGDDNASELSIIQLQ